MKYGVREVEGEGGCCVESASRVVGIQLLVAVGRRRRRLSSSPSSLASPLCEVSVEHFFSLVAAGDIMR